MALATGMRACGAETAKAAKTWSAEPPPRASLDAGMRGPSRALRMRPDRGVADPSSRASDMEIIRNRKKESCKVIFRSATVPAGPHGDCHDKGLHRESR